MVSEPVTPADGGCFTNNACIAWCRQLQAIASPLFQPYPSTAWSDGKMIFGNACMTCESTDSWNAKKNFCKSMAWRLSHLLAAHMAAVSTMLLMCISNINNCFCDLISLSVWMSIALEAVWFTVGKTACAWLSVTNSWGHVVGSVVCATCSRPDIPAQYRCEWKLHTCTTGLIDVHHFKHVSAMEHYLLLHNCISPKLLLWATHALRVECCFSNRGAQFRFWITKLTC